VNSAGKIGIGIASGVGTALTIDVIHQFVVKREAFAYAKTLANNKGIINLGAGPHRTLLAQEISESSEVAVNVDIAPDGMPKFLQLDIEQERVPFSDKEFGCAFMSHVLEHLDNWEFALSEGLRVADYVVVVLPHPLSLTGWLWPSHRQHFSLDKMRDMEKLLPNVKVFY